MITGIETFFINVGNADAVFVRYWVDGSPFHILVDGGKRGDVATVKAFLKRRFIESGHAVINHLVCSHAHDDHAGGLVGLVKENEIEIAEAWVHDSRVSNRVLTPERIALLETVGASRLSKVLNESEATRHELVDALQKQGVYPKAPFRGARIGPMIVLSPSPQFFDQQFLKLDNPDIIRALNRRYAQREVPSLMTVLQQVLLEEKEDSESALGGEPTSLENEVSTVLAVSHNDKWHILTADVGCEGLADVLTTYPVLAQKDIDLLQIPHHGSRRNMNETLIKVLKPKSACVSAKGSSKHPSKKLVKAFQAIGTKVWSTHYQDFNSIVFQMGETADIPTKNAVPLWEPKP